ncbi:MAG: sensor histidine kinase [Alphaproteobacteria bacterium]
MQSRILRTIKTFTFRLTLVYVGLFALSVIFLFGFIYTFSMSYVRDQMANYVRGQYYYLLNAYRENGSEGVEQSIQELMLDDPEGTEIYLLVNKEKEKLAGNLNKWPETVGIIGPFEDNGEWIRFQIEDMRDQLSGIEVNAIRIPLSEWRSLLVGQSTLNTDKIEQTIIQTFWASMALSFLMALTGALILTRSVVGRINVINQSAGRIMQGNISERFPFTPGGDEFDELSLNLNRMLDTIENLLQSLSQFANNIAHDLRSPLNRIISRLDAGLRDIEPKNPAMTLLRKNIHDMENLVDTFNAILKISELEANTEMRPSELCDLQEILAEVAEFYEPYAIEHGLALRCNPHEPTLVYGDKKLLTQAFANLIDNALKFTPSGGSVTIDTERTEHFATAVIADTGPGIPADRRKKVFEKFVRLEQSRNTKGNGLGLSMVDAIARIHTARIELDDNTPGLIVRIFFPRGA